MHGYFETVEPCEIWSFLKCTYSWANWYFHTHFRGYYCTWSVIISFEINQVLIRPSSEMLSVQTVHSEPVSTISSYMYIFSANCSYTYESNNYYGSNEVLQLLVFSVKCDNNNCKRKLQTFQRKRKNLIWVTHNFKRLAQPESSNAIILSTLAQPE